MELYINPVTASRPLVTPFVLPSNTANRRSLKTSDSINSRGLAYQYEDHESQVPPLTDITLKTNIRSRQVGPLASCTTRENDKQTRTLSNNLGLAIGLAMESSKTPHCAAKSRQIFCGNTQWGGFKTGRGKSPMHQRFNSPKSCCMFSPAQYGMVTDRRKAIMKEYYKKKKDIQKKYANMLNELKQEEMQETKWAILKGKKSSNIEEALEEIKQEYAITGNLIQQQKMVEEEELLREYKTSICA